MSRRRVLGHPAPPGADGPLAAGEVVVLVDRKRRRHLLTLAEGAEWQSHAGGLEHDRIIGRPEGCAVRTSRNEAVLVLRPTREDLVLGMPRAAQVVYGKDRAMIVALGDVRPGCRVVEAGAGSGALTMSLLDAVGPRGSVHSFELREDHAAVARANVATSHGPDLANWTLTVGDVADGLAGLTADRVVLDLVDPWRLVDPAAAALTPGGVLVAYLPSVPQVMRLTEALWQHGSFADVRTSETLVRGWDVDGLAVRPAHRMVAHTAFLTTARRVLPPEEGGPLRARRRSDDGPGVAWLDVAEPASDDGPVA